MSFTKLPYWRYSLQACRPGVTLNYLDSIAVQIFVDELKRVCVLVSVCVCVRAYARACMHVCVCASVSVKVHPWV